MPRQPALLLYPAAILLLLASVSPVTAAEPARPRAPNIVLILADDLGYADLGCYGNRVNRTPRLDRLAKSGVRLLDFHSNGANCSPTRAALLTGRYQQRLGIDGALGEGAAGLDKSEVTLAERLRTAGYATGIFGKWHLGYHPHRGPTRHGFDTFVGHLHGATDYLSHVDKYGRMDWWHNERPVVESGHNTKLITDHSVRFIEAHRDQPFFLFVSHSAIHFPWMTSADSPHRQAGTRYEDKLGKLGPHADGPLQPVVQAMIEELDDSVGRILDTLRRLELERNTLVFFTSDNGGIVRTAGVPATAENRISSNAPWRGEKHSLHEGGHRVPAIAYWPGALPAGVTSDAAAMTIDLFPTLLELAELPAPLPDSPHALDGISILSHLKTQAPLPDRPLYWQQHNSQAIRHGDWKAVSQRGGPFQLYNLRQDPAEQNDLAKDQPQRLQQLRTQLTAWQQQFPQP